MEEKQNFIKTLGLNKEPLSDIVRTSCIILFYPYSEKDGNRVNYCHFDENNLNELKSFAEVGKKRNANKIAFLGGYRSQNVVPLLRFFHENGLAKLTDKDFTSAPVKNLNFDSEGLTLTDVNNSDRSYSFKELNNLFY